MIVSEELIRQIEISEAGRVRSSAAAYGGQVLELSTGVAANCGPGNVMTQSVGLGLAGDVEEADLNRLLALYLPDCPHFEFKLSPLSPLALREWTLKRAASIPEFETTLVRELDNLPSSTPELDFREVDRESAAEYGARCARRFSGGEPPPGIVEVVAAACVGEDVRSHEVYVDGGPVAGCSLGFANGIAWLAGAAVDPPYRGRGLHKAMQAFRVELARSLGFRLVCQGALPGSVSQQNAQKSGFEIAFTRPTFLLRADCT